VTCVEQGRWGYEPTKVAFATGTHESVDIRADKLRQLAQRSKMRGVPLAQKFVASQSRVWEKVGAVMASHDVSSDTGALNDLYSSGKVSAAIDDIVDGIKLPEGTRGVVVATGGKMVGADVFEDTEVFGIMWQRLVRSYAMSALHAKGNPPSMEAAETFLNAPADASWNATPSPGMGEDVRWEGQHFAAASLVWQSRHLHASVFAL
jgi:hypothetical protein